MKILYVSQFFKPERVAAAFRAYDNAKAWNEAGEEITVFTGYPNFPTGKLFEGYKIKLLSEEKFDGIRVLRSKIIIKENTSKLKRIINSLSFLFFGIYNIIFKRKIIGKDYDVVLGTSGTVLATIIAYVFSKINKIPFVLEIRDITYIQMLAVYKGKKTILYKLIKWLELFLCRKAKKIVVVTNGFKNELVSVGIESNKIEVIHNGININDVGFSNAINNDEIVFSYMGNIGASQNLEKIINIFNEVKLDKYNKKLIIIGDGAKKEAIKEYIKDNNIHNIIIKDGMSPEELEKYYDISDFCIVSLNNTEFFKNTVPSKIFQIMGRGKNIIFFGPDGEASSIISNVDKKFIYTQTKNELIKKNLNMTLNSTKDLKIYLLEKGKAAREYIINNYDRNVLAERYKIILETIIENK